ncbi:hypothetical protein AAG570_000793 [Ranatra chinensis]|uniref:ELMO domain-containing protein n=1 Tax=Ranatra chinensis TaxID=642074 RepID=A0ABD0YY39_9HEMI
MWGLEKLWLFLYWQLRPLVKWFLRKTTKLCELQRICYGKPAGCLRSQAVEFSLYHSRSTEIKTMIARLEEAARKKELSGAVQKAALGYAVKTVVMVKGINMEYHRPFVKSFGRCVEHIWGYKQLYNEVESLRLTQFDSNDPKHEEILMRLWNAMKPHNRLEARITKQWQDIGFQGDDPKTDFRGMGMLGLENLVYFGEEYSGAAVHVLSHSLHPQYGYAYAIVGINITSLAYDLLKDGSLKTHVYNACKSMPTLRVFHLLYCYLFYEFDKFWVESKPKDVMEFTFIKDKFETNIRNSLADPTTTFKINFVVDTI